MYFVRTWTQDYPHTQSTQTGRRSLLNTSATPQTNLVGALTCTHTHTRWPNRKNANLMLMIFCLLLDRQTQHLPRYFHIILHSSPFCINSHRCYQGEPLLHPPKQHHSPSLPAHLPGTYLQSTQGDSKNNMFSVIQNCFCSHFALTGLKSEPK